MLSIIICSSSKHVIPVNNLKIKYQIAFFNFPMKLLKGRFVAKGLKEPGFGMLHHTC